jgi:hypothetical protein
MQERHWRNEQWLKQGNFSWNMQENVGTRNPFDIYAEVLIDPRGSGIVAAEAR